MKHVLVMFIVASLPGVAAAQDPYGQPPQQGYADPGQQQPQGYAPQSPVQGQGPGYDQPQGQGYDQQQQDPNANEMQYGYFGPHPEPYQYGNQPCMIEGAHFHPYPPFDRYLFREANGYFYFIGDMGDFAYQGQQWGYQGNHPLPPQYGGGFCYIDWPHHHPFPPPPSLTFNFINGFYAYAGPWDPAYYTYRSAWSAYFGGYYRANYFGGRYWTVRPSPIYRPSYGWGARGVYRPGMSVYAPGGARIVVNRGPVGGRYGGAYVGGRYVAPVGGGAHYVGGGGGVQYNNGGHYVAAPAAHYAAPRAEPVRAAPVMHAEPMRAAPMRSERRR